MVAGKSIYFTELELEMIRLSFDQFNRSLEGYSYDEEEEKKRTEAADSIFQKVSK